MKGNNKIEINIPLPCAQNWEEMTPSGSGRFCSECRQKVIDFSLMTDSQIVDILSKNSQQHLCGRFGITQVNRPLNVIKDREMPLRLTSRMAASLLLIQSIVISTWAQTAKAGTKITVAEKKAHPKVQRKLIKGEVIDLQTGQPLKGMLVTIAGTDLKAVTNAAGRFCIALPKGIIDTITLTTTYSTGAAPTPHGTIIYDKVVSLNEYKTGKEVKIFRHTEQKLETVTVTINRPLVREMRTHIMGGIGGSNINDVIIMQMERRKTLWQRVTGIFRKKNKDQER